MIDSESIRVVVFQDGDKWVAQCLEYDIGAQADDTDKLLALFTAVLAAEMDESTRRHGRAFAGINAAPPHFQAMWDKRSRAFESIGKPVPDNRMNLDMALVA